MLDIYFQQRCLHCGAPLSRPYFQFNWSTSPGLELQWTARFCSDCYAPAKTLLYNEAVPRTAVAVLDWLLRGIERERFDPNKVTNLECFARKFR